MSDEWKVVGRVRSVNPRGRDVRVAATKGYAYVFADMAWIQFRRGGDEPLRCKVIRTRTNDESVIVELSPGVSRDVVGELRSALVVMAEEEIPPRPGQKVRLVELLGLRVVLPTGATLGTIGEVYEGPANDAFAVDRPDGGRSILPVIEAVIESVDLDLGEVVVGDITPFVVEED